MSLPPEMWIALRLDVEVVRARAAYFSAYARSEQPLFESTPLIRALRDGLLATGDQAVVSLLHAGDGGAVAELRRRIAEAGEGPGYPSWVRVAERADALRQSAMAELLYDTPAGVTTLRRSGGEYRRLGLPFGSFLDTAATGSPRNAFIAGRRLAWLLNPQAPPEPDEEGIIPLERALDAPAQQVSVLLTTMSVLDAIYEFEVTSDSLASTAQSGGSAPVGVTSQPIALWWECAVHLADLAFGRSQARDELRTLLRELAAAHGIQLRNAQYDAFHWPVAASPVDLVDLDLAGLVAISARLLRQLNGPYWDLPDDFGALSPLSQVSIRVGLDLASQDGTPTDLSSPSPPPQSGPVFDPQSSPGHSSRVIS